MQGAPPDVAARAPPAALRRRGGASPRRALLGAPSGGEGGGGKRREGRGPAEQVTLDGQGQLLLGERPPAGSRASAAAAAAEARRFPGSPVSRAASLILVGVVTRYLSEYPNDRNCSSRETIRWQETVRALAASGLPCESDEAFRSCAVRRFCSSRISAVRFCQQSSKRTGPRSGVRCAECRPARRNRFPDDQHSTHGR